MKKYVFIILFSTVLLTSVLSYTLEDVMFGVERTTSVEYSIPYFQWVNKVQGEISAGYDPFEKRGIFGVQAGLKMFENLDLGTSFSLSTDFASQTNYQFSVGVTYDFLSTGESERRYREAQKEIIARKLNAVDLFFEYLKKKVLLKSDDGTDILLTTDNKVTQVDMAYLAIKIEALSSLQSGEPQISGLSNYIPKKIEDDVVLIAVKRYLSIFEDFTNNDESLYAVFRTDYNSFSQGISAGIGGSMDFEKPISKSVKNKLDEIEIRKHKLMHDVIVEQLPILHEVYSELENEINSATTALINGTITKDQLKDKREQFTKIEDRYIELTLEAVKLETIFKVLVGDM